MITDHEAQKYIAKIVSSRDQFFKFVTERKKELDATVSQAPVDMKNVLTAMINYNVACTIMSHCLGKLEAAYILIGYSPEEAKKLSDDAGYFGLENLK